MWSTEALPPGEETGGGTTKSEQDAVAEWSWNIYIICTEGGNLRPVSNLRSILALLLLPIILVTTSMPVRLSLLRNQLDDNSRSSNVGAFANARVSPAVTSSRHEDIATSEAPLPKRRKINGLNNRFDRMLDKVNVSHSYSHSSRAPHHRNRSSGSSSVSSYDIPKTPIDAYSGLSEGRLGVGFSVLKMRGQPDFFHSPNVKSSSDDDFQILPSTLSLKKPKPLPNWLVSTFQTLGPEHPLRGLLPLEQDVTREWVAHAVVPASETRAPAIEPAERSVPDEIFAFNPFCAEIELEQAIETSLSSSVPPDGKDDAIYRHLTPIFSNDLDNDVVVNASPEINSMLISGNPSLHDDSPAFNYAVASPTLVAQDHARLFSTPGPNFAQSRTVYFDSPLEDPASSDSLEPQDFELDLESLDFRWTPFDRKDVLHQDSLQNLPTFNHRTIEPDPKQFSTGTIHNDANIDSCYVPTTEEDSENEYWADDDEDFAMLADIPNTDFLLSLSSSRSSTPAEEGNKPETVFAPAPGIFISPLRNAPDSPDPSLHPMEEKAKGAEVEASKKIDPPWSLKEEDPDPVMPYPITSTPPRPSQTHTSQPETPRKDRSAVVRSSSRDDKKILPYPDKNPVAWMLAPSKRSAQGLEEIDSTSSHSSDNGNDSIESWTR
ncbi:hypothetical protein BJ138DRAFT_1212496 [Hygrophoropsis aurantiaca]|uniref:Uncharacterized protein n=1 Tax=Hygrophoropsis aurantiaca TaxID=72124 RepID=A0ACB8ALS6_9AGAM|nr:hypothetical protein BJ138DRAFT_1212496 [Hygrophoropsis aurantiaca]